MDTAAEPLRGGEGNLTLLSVVALMQDDFMSNSPQRRAARARAQFSGVNVAGMDGVN